MDSEKDSQFSVGYKKTPRHTRFKPGQSGNPSGRPKKKGITLAEAVEYELNTRMTVTEGGKKKKITKAQAIAKGQTNKAVNGDPKAAAFVMKALEPRQFDTTDSFPHLLYEMRAIHAKHEAVDNQEDDDED